MAFEDDVMDISFIAGGDLTSSQYRFVKLSADNTVVICNNTTDTPIGVLQTQTKQGEVARVRIMGISRVVAGGTVTYGNKIGTDATGAGVAKTADKAIYMGIVTESGASGEEVSVLVTGVPKTISA